MNNRLIYTDPSGESILGLLVFGYAISQVSGVVDAISSGGINPHLSSEQRQQAWTKADPFKSGTIPNNYWAINRGLFHTDPNRTTGGRIWQGISRFTWELPQTAAGLGFAHFNNMIGQVDNIYRFHGATLIDTRWGNVYTGLSLSNYLFGKDMIPSYRDHRMIHEYGHYIQSQRWGWGFLPIIGVPSLQSVLIGLETVSHKHRWYERRANILGGEYFDKYYGSGKDDYISDHRDFFQLHYFYEGSEIYRANPPYYIPSTEILEENRGGGTGWRAFPREEKAGAGTALHYWYALLLLMTSF